MKATIKRYIGKVLCIHKKKPIIEEIQQPIIEVKPKRKYVRKTKKSKE